MKNKKIVPTLADKGSSFAREIGMIVVNIFISMVLGSILILAQGENPLEVYYYLLIDPLTSMSGILKVLGKATPLIFCGLAATVAFRCSLFNVGIEGQIYLGGLAAAAVALYVPISTPVLKVLCCLVAAMAVAGAWAALAGWLKTRFHVHEVLSTIMLNYVASAMVSFLLLNFMKEDGINPRTNPFPDNALLPQLAPPDQVNVGLFLSLLAAVVLIFLIYRTSLGWRIDAVGKNMTAARFAGISAKKVLMAAICISGMLGGLAGAERVMGAYGYMELNFSPGYGYDGMIVAVIARNNPVGAVIVGLFMGLLHYGGVNINMYTDISIEWVYVLIAVMFILVVADSRIINSVRRGVCRLFQIGKRGEGVK